MNKISWNDYFLSMAYLAATRSSDVHTKCGAVIVDGENRIVSVGYNGAVRGLNDSKVPLTRPEKYPWMIHAEINALATANLDRNSSYKIYTTGHPCFNCLQTCVQNGIYTFIFEKGQAANSLAGQENLFFEFFKAAGEVYEMSSGSYISCSSYSYGKKILVRRSGFTDIEICPLEGSYQALERAYSKVSNSYLHGLTR